MITMAAHLEGQACQAIDQFGMAQKGGAVTSHIRLAATANAISAVHLDSGSADLVLGCDALVAAGDLALKTVSSERTRLVINTHQAITGHFTRSPDLEYPKDDLDERLKQAAGASHLTFIDATRIATRLMGDAIATNMFMLGYAYQRGLIPVSSSGIEQAITLNGIAVESNIQTFRWGRRAALDIEAVSDLAYGKPTSRNAEPETLSALIETRTRDLTDYQNATYAGRYQALIQVAREAEETRAAGLSGFTLAVARFAYKLMAYKDEYEVARLYSDSAFTKELNETFEGPFRLQFHFAPPVFSTLDPHTGLATKRTYGHWMFGLSLIHI